MSALRSAAAAAAAAAVLSTAPVLATDEAPATITEIVVTATRTRQPVTEVAVPVIVITRAAIEDTLAGDAADLLAALPGVEIARSGGPGQPATLFLRGTDSNHTAVLIDGVRINPGTIGGAAIQNVLPESIERIEIVKGARSTLYGTDAIGGVINIITRAGAGTARGASAFASAGRYGTNAFAVDGGTALGSAVDAGASIAWQNSDGFAPLVSAATRRGYHNRSGNLGITWHANEALSFTARAWRASGVSEYTGYDSSFDLRPVSQDFRTAAYAAAATWRLPDTLAVHATLSRVEDLIDQNQNPDYAHTRRDSLDLQLDAPLAASQRLTAGALLARERANALSYGSLLRTRTDTRLLYAQDQIRIGAGELLLAAGHNHHQTFGNRWTWNAELVHPLLRALQLRLAAGTAFHAPDASDRLGYGGNPDLGPEFAHEYAAGLAWQPGAGQTLRLDAFENRIDDLAEFVLVDPLTYGYQMRNVGSARIRGLEAGYQLAVAGWQLDAAATLQDPRNRETGSALLRRARHYFALRIARSAGPVDASAELRASGARLDAGFPADVRVSGYLLVNLGVRWRVTPAWDLQLRLDNACDERYELINGYRTARRSLTVATRYRLR